MYSTCIGLILKGYNDYENKHKGEANNMIKIHSEITEEEVVAEQEEESQVEEGATKPEKLPRQKRKTIKAMMDSFKTNLIEMFKEEEDSKF